MKSESSNCSRQKEQHIVNLKFSYCSSTLLESTIPLKYTLTLLLVVRQNVAYSCFVLNIKYELPLTRETNCQNFSAGMECQFSGIMRFVPRCSVYVNH